MKKVLTLIVMVVAMSMPSQAQIKFGVQGGLNLTNMSFSKDVVSDAIKNKTGFFIGPTIKFTLPIVGLSLDGAALYDQREAKVSDQTIKSQTLQVPINVRYGIGLGSVLNVFAFAGPQFGFNLGSKTKEIQSNIAEWTLKSSNLSANVGLGATVLDHLQVKINYNIALGKTGEVEVWDATKSVWNSVSDGKANAWQISAAYYF